MARSFQARYAPQFVRDLQKLEPSVRQRILRAIETKLLPHPVAHAKKLKGKTSPGQWRFRVGDYRIRFDVQGSCLLFYRVRHRREIYQ